MATPTTTEFIPIAEINSSCIRAEAAQQGCTHVRFIAEGGESERHITIYGLSSRNGIEFRVAATNGDPVWEEQDLAEFAELLLSVGIDA